MKLPVKPKTLNPFPYPNGLLKRMVLTSFLFFLTITVAFAQKEGHIGIFAFGTGLDFNFSPPKVFRPEYEGEQWTGGEFLAIEGCATISDKNGNLLFYTNGMWVYNRHHKIMKNGDYIQGENYWSLTTTQIIIVPLPKNPFIYYIFTVDFQGRALAYTMVDMRLDNQLGAVTLKNQPIYGNASEKLCVVEHSSGEKLWLITHEFGTNAYRTFLIDENGLNTTYVESAVGVVHAENVQYTDSSSSTNTNAIGYLKPSPDGNTLASAISGEMGVLEIFDFDKSTGKVYNPRKLFEDPEKGSYGVEFSPEGSKLYLSCTESEELFQFDLTAGSVQDIINTAQLIPGVVNGALQLGPDNKIYAIGTQAGKYLARVNSPNASGLACHFEQDAVYLNGSSTLLGLPEFKYRVIAPDIVYQQACPGYLTQFNLSRTEFITDVYWDFGNPAAGSENHSSELSPTHQYEAPGTYTIQVVVKYSNKEPKTFTSEVSISSLSVDLGEEAIICDSLSLTLSPQVSGENLLYRWQDGSTLPSFTADTSGYYWVELSNGVCSEIDSIYVKHLTFPQFEVKDTVICQGEHFYIALDDPETTYAWQDGFTQGSRSISRTENYTVTASNQCGSFSQEFTVTVLPELRLDLPEELLICKNEELILDVSSEAAHYRWQDNSTDPTYKITEEGTYWVEVYTKCETITDTVKVYNAHVRDLIFPNVITPNGDDFNEYFVIDQRLIGSQLSIINRWGKEVYFSSSYQNDWNGEENAPGVYYYLLQENCSQQLLKGPIQLLK